jgi:hypothetical protein
MDLFDEALEKKIRRLEKWIYRLQKEMWFLKNVYNLTQKKKIPTDVLPDQFDMFAG